jgi:two-component system chemotaxis response regulator CheY
MIKKILIVDDSQVARAIVKKCLPKDRDFELTEASNGQEGVQKFKEVRPDLTLLDLTMPVMDGFDALKAIKEEDNLAVVMVLSSDIQKKTVEKVVTLGADMVIPKPPSAESIQEALTKAAKLLV